MNINWETQTKWITIHNSRLTQIVDSGRRDVTWGEGGTVTRFEINHVSERPPTSRNAKDIYRSVSHCTHCSCSTATSTRTIGEVGGGSGAGAAAANQHAHCGKNDMMDATVGLVGCGGHNGTGWILAGLKANRRFASAAKLSQSFPGEFQVYGSLTDWMARWCSWAARSL